MPNEYRVQVADPKTGKTRWIEVKADSPAEVEEQMARRGWNALKVTLYKEGKPSRKPSEPQTTKAPAGGLKVTGFLMRVLGVLVILAGLGAMASPSVGGVVAGVGYTVGGVVMFGFGELLWGVSVLINQLHTLNAKQ